MSSVVTQETDFGVYSTNRSLNPVWLFALLTARGIHLITNQRKENRRQHFALIVEVTNCKQVSRKCIWQLWILDIDNQISDTQFQDKLLKLETLVTSYVKVWWKMIKTRCWMIGGHIYMVDCVTNYIGVINRAWPIAALFKTQNKTGSKTKRNV